jgi:hypothetical protein
MAEINLQDVWTAVTDVAREVTSEADVNLAQNGFVVPKGISSPNELTGWHGDPGHMYRRMTWTSQWFIYLTTPTKIKVGAVWYFGGQVNGHGRYIGNADIYFLVESIGPWERFNVRGTFESPLTVENDVAQLSGQVQVDYYEYSSLSSKDLALFQLRGDGAGKIWWA